LGDYGEVRGGKGEPSKIEGVGNVLLKRTDKKGYGTLELAVVYYVPNFGVNLVSAGIIRDRSTVIFHKMGGEIRTPEGELICTIKVQGKMSILNAKASRPVESYFTEQVKGDISTWLARFGHASYNAVREAQKMKRE
jgi:hypothetical protein